MTRRIMLRVAYDGTRYHGWQEQPNGETIEGVLKRELARLTGEPVRLIGASRTDSGVHALCNAAVFDTSFRMPADKFSYALNARLPEDIRVRSSREVPPDFHPRKCESRKTYQYWIDNEAFPNPLKRLYSHFVYVPLDEAKMREGAEFLLGTHDFASFCNPDTAAETTRRTICELSVIRDGSDILIRACGHGFLYHMVRIIAGTLIEVGRGSLKPRSVADILAARDRQAAGPTAPARGLCLTGLEFLPQDPLPL